MKQKRLLIYVLVALVLAVLFYLQFRTWSGFDWSIFGSQTANVGKHLPNVLAGIGITYFAYVLRALRWKIFLRPVQPTTTSRELLAPTIIGFTGLALLGRPGELIRPYLIGRKVRLNFSSQIAVWTVERFFDVGSFAILFAFAMLNPDTRTLLSAFHVGRVSLALMGIGLLTLILLLVRGETIAGYVARWLSKFAPNLGHQAAVRIREFRAGLNTIHSFSSLLQLIAVSVVMWTMIGFAYWQVMESYGVASLDRPQQVPLIMASSMVGSMVQLPGVGGGSQLATIFTMQKVLGVPRELAASCGILLWMVTFMSVIPLGLTLAHRERVSLRTLSKESQAQEGLAEG